MSKETPNDDVHQENVLLLQKIQYYEQVLMAPTTIKVEDLSDELIQKEHEISSLKTKLNDVTKELQILKEDRSVQEEVARNAKMYSTLLENMLDEERASYAPKCSGESCPAARGIKDELENAQQEKRELEEIMEEFRNMWTKDTNDFQKAMTTVKDEGTKLQSEISRFQRLYQDAQESISKFSYAILEEEHARKEEVAKSSQLETQVKNLTVQVEKGQCEIRVLSKKNEDLEHQLSQQESQLKYQDDELAKALDKLLTSGEKTIQQAEQLKMEKEAHELKLGELTKQLENEKKQFERVKTEANEQIRHLCDEDKELRHEYSSYQAATAKQLQMMKSECNLNYERYVKFENESLKLQKSLKECKEKSEKEAKIFNATIESLASELCETKSQLKTVSCDYEDMVAKLQSVTMEAMNSEEEIQSLTTDLKDISYQHECAAAENEQLRDKLNAAVRDYVAEREKLEQKQEEAIFGLQQMHLKQIEEVKHNNMLAINQEMIKAQMALDSTKKKSAIEYETIKTKLVHSVCENDRLKKESEARILSLSQDMATVKINNASLLFECAQLKTSQSQANATLAKLNSQIDDLEEEAIAQKECHEKEIQNIKEAHRILLDNMGVEELDGETDDVEEAVDVKNDSAQWELVDEE